jgi:hypothetical protein
MRSIFPESTFVTEQGIGLSKVGCSEFVESTNQWKSSITPTMHHM